MDFTLTLTWSPPTPITHRPIEGWAGLDAARALPGCEGIDPSIVEPVPDPAEMAPPHLLELTEAQARTTRTFKGQDTATVTVRSKDLLQYLSPMGIVEKDEGDVVVAVRWTYVMDVDKFVRDWVRAGEPLEWAQTEAPKAEGQGQGRG